MRSVIASPQVVQVASPVSRIGPVTTRAGLTRGLYAFSVTCTASNASGDDRRHRHSETRCGSADCSRASFCPCKARNPGAASGCRRTSKCHGRAKNRSRGRARQPQHATSAAGGCGVRLR